MEYNEYLCGDSGETVCFVYVVGYFLMVIEVTRLCELFERGYATVVLPHDSKMN